MTAKKSFLSEVKKFSKVLEDKIISDWHLENQEGELEKAEFDEGRIPDIEIMMALDYTPPSWKVWRPQFIEYFNNYTEDPFSNVFYEKKTKHWVIHFNPDTITKLAKIRFDRNTKGAPV